MVGFAITEAGFISKFNGCCRNQNMNIGHRMTIPTV